MNKLNSNEIINLLEILIGQTEAVGDSAQDDKIEENLMTLIDVTNWCLDGIMQSSEIEEAMHRFVNLPTIEAEPVRHGRWEYKHFSSEPHCSLCLAEYPIETNYCPNCGAKMDGCNDGGLKDA